MYSTCELQVGQFPNSFSSVYSLFSNDIYSWSMWDAVRGNEQVVMQLMCEGLVCILMGHCWPAIWYVPSLDETRGVQSSWRISGKCCFGLFTVYLHLAECFFPPWNSIDVLIWKHRFRMYFKTLLDWTPDPEIHFWKSSLFSDLKIKAQTPLSKQFQENFVTVVMGLYIFSQICGCLPQKCLYGLSFHICVLYWMSACSKIFVEFCATWRTPCSSYA